MVPEENDGDRVPLLQLRLLRLALELRGAAMVALQDALPREVSELPSDTVMFLTLADTVVPGATLLLTRKVAEKTEALLMAWVRELSYSTTVLPFISMAQGSLSSREVPVSSRLLS